MIEDRNTLLMVLAVLQLIDAYTTHTILARGGRELNPVMRWIFDRTGVITGLIVKGAAVVAIGWSVQDIQMLQAIVGAYVVLAVWNIKGVLR